MTTATAPTTWPTEESLAPAQAALNAAFNEVESVLNSLDKILTPWVAEGVYPDPLPTTATVGTLYSFLETLRTEVMELEHHAKGLEEHLGNIDGMRLDAKAAARREARDGSDAR